MNAETMLPCPHCGYVFEAPPYFDDLIMDDAGDSCAIVCPNGECSACGPVAFMGYNGTEDEAVTAAIAAWNRRADLQAALSVPVPFDAIQHLINGCSLGIDDDAIEAAPIVQEWLDAQHRQHSEHSGD